MFFNNLLKSGWLHALFIAVIAYPMASMTQKIVASYTEVNLLAYTGVFLLASAIALLFIGGPGELANATLRRFETWAYAFLQIISYILFLFSVSYATATQGAALTMIGGLFIMLFSITFLRQKTNIFEMAGSLIMIFGLYLVIANADMSIENKTILTIIVVLRGLVVSMQKIITELHKTNRKAVSFKSQVRVTGFIMAVASFVYLAFLVVIAFFKQEHNVPFFEPFPMLSDFANMEMFLFSMFVGFIVVSSSKYCEFYAGKTIGAKYLTSITSLQIIFVYVIETALTKMGVLNKAAIDHTILVAVAFVLLGNFIISMAGFIKDLNFIKKGEKQDTLANLDENHIEDEKDFKILKLNLSNLLALYDNDSKKLSTDIKVERIILDNIANYDFSEVRVKIKVAKKINDFASENAATKDKLTKAHNRYYLEHKTKELFKDGLAFKLYYIDLDKFKPINDNHGHEVGDKVLAKLVVRLTSLPEFTDCIFRIGGDEFVLLQVNDLETNLTDIILKTIEQPLVIDENTLEISASIGMSLSTNYNNLVEMLKAADDLMFEDKNK